MKKIIFIAFILITAFAYLYCKDARILNIEKEYNIVNEADKEIPGALYCRNADVEIGDRIENVYEIVIFFDEKLKMKLNPIVVIPKYKFIGLIEGGESGFIKFGSKVFQLSDESNKFTMLDNTTYFNDPPIKKKNFEGKLISFNSFEKLKDYGQTVILKKIK